MAQPTTGTPLARSLLGALEIPKQSRAGLWLALGAGLIAVIALSAVGVSLATRGKHAANSAAVGQDNAGSVAPPAAAAPPTPAQPLPVATLVESPPPAAEMPSTPGSAPAQPVPKPAKPAAQPPSPKSTPAPAKPTKGKPVDLGI
jgi:hypothetical protein